MKPESFGKKFIEVRFLAGGELPPLSPCEWTLVGQTVVPAAPPDSLQRGNCQDLAKLLGSTASLA